MPRDLSVAAQTAADAEHGYTACNLVDLEFDSTVRAIADGAAFSQISGAITALGGENSLNGTNLFANVRPERWIKVDGFNDNRNNGYFYVASKPTNSKIILSGRRLTPEIGSGITIDGHFKPDTLIEWEHEPVSVVGAVTVDTSIDNGKSWQPCVTGRPIPNIGIGDTLFGRKLLVRQTFDNVNVVPWIGAAVDPILKKVRVKITFDDGSVLERIEDTYEEFSQGVLDSVTADDDDIVRARKSTALSFATLPIGAHVPRTGVNEEKLHISKGEEFTVQISGGTWVAERFSTPAAAAFSVELQVTFGIVDEGYCQLISFDGDLQSNPPFLPLGGFGHQQGFELRRNGGTLEGWFRQWGPPGVDPDNPHLLFRDNLVAGDFLFQVGREYSIAATYDGLVARLFVDGREIGSSILPDAVVETRGKIWLGQFPTGAIMVPSTGVGAFATAFVGDMREVRLWDRALSQGEINSHMLLPNRTFSASVVARELTSDTNPGLAGYWRLDDVDAAVPDLVNDVTGFANHMRVEGVTFSYTVKPNAGGRDVGGVRKPYRLSPPLDLAVTNNIVSLTNAPMDIEANGRIYLGVGSLGQIEPIEETGRLESRGLKLTLSGVVASFLSLALSTPHLERPVKVYLAFLETATGLLVEDPVLIFDGKIDTMPVVVGDVNSVSVTAEHRLIDWSRPSLRRWGDNDQRSRFPDDYGLEFVAEMADREVWWPGRVNFDKAFAVVSVMVGLFAGALTYLGLTSW